MLQDTGTWALLVSAAIGAVVVIVTCIHRHHAKRFVRRLRGPSSPSLLIGHLEQWSHQQEVGGLEQEWHRQYGTVWRLKGCLNEDMLMVADPKALQYILHKSGYHFSKGARSNVVTREIIGEGSIVAATGADHARMRKIISPAFSQGQLQSYYPQFRRSAWKLGRIWIEALQNGPRSSQRMDILDWLSRCTLDGLGEVAFDIDCGALDDAVHPIVHAYKNMFAESMAFPSRTTLVFRSFYDLIPDPILRLTKYIPTKEHTHFRRTLQKIRPYARAMIQAKACAVFDDSEKTRKRDVMSIIVRANVAEEPKHRLSDQEMISQISGLLLAGHETTSNTLAWLFYELSRHPEHQATLRAEIQAVRARVTTRGDAEFSLGDMDSMHFVVATIKETLRLHPIVYMLTRLSTREEVLPLAFPVTDVDGEIMSEIPIPKGTNLSLSFWQYNRLTEIWGPDADEFNPSRFVGHEKLGETYVGVTSNLLSFSAGLQACIGWRFAMIQMQAIVVELIEHFTFAIPEDKPEVLHLPSGLATPIVKGNKVAGAQMPLQVTII